MGAQIDKTDLNDIIEILLHVYVSTIVTEEEEENALKPWNYLYCNHLFLLGGGSSCRYNCWEGIRVASKVVGVSSIVVCGWGVSISGMGSDSCSCDSWGWGVSISSRCSDGDSWGWGSSNCHWSWNWSGSHYNWLCVDVRLGSDFSMDIGLSCDLLVDIGLSCDLLVDIGLSGNVLLDMRLGSNLLVDIWDSLDLVMDIFFGCDLLVNVWLSNGVDLASVVIWAAIGQSSWSDCWGKSWDSTGGNSHWAGISIDCWVVDHSSVVDHSAGGGGSNGKSTNKSLHFEIMGMNC